MAKKAAQKQNGPQEKAIDMSGGMLHKLKLLRTKILQKLGGDRYLQKGIEGFDLNKWKAEAKKDEPYFFNGNFFWVEEFSNGCAVRDKNVQDAVNLIYPEPARIPVRIDMPMNSKVDDPKTKFLAGNMPCVSPEEDRLVIYSAILRDFEDADKMKRWAEELQRVPMSMRVLTTHKEKHMHDVKYREQQVSRTALIQRTMYGRMVEVWNFYARTEEKLSSKDLADSYRENLSATSEAVTDSFIDNTKTIMSRAVLPLEDVRMGIEELENNHGREWALGEISKMLAVVEKAQSQKRIRWCFLAIFDAFKAGPTQLLMNLGSLRDSRRGFEASRLRSFEASTF